MMTLERLREYPKLAREIALLQARLDALDRDIERRLVADSVRGSSPDYPYNQHTIIIEGFDVQRPTRLRALIAERKERLEAEELAIETWLSTVEDSNIRQIVEHHIIGGRSWAATATRVYGYPDGDIARKALKRYLKKTK